MNVLCNITGNPPFRTRSHNSPSNCTGKTSSSRMAYRSACHSLAILAVIRQTALTTHPVWDSHTTTVVVWIRHLPTTADNQRETELDTTNKRAYPVTSHHPRIHS